MAGLSETDVANIALIALGESRITALSDADERARVLNDLFAPAVEAVLEAHPWNAAIKRVQLAQDATAPVFGYSYRYALPADLLRILNDDTRNDPPIRETTISDTEIGWKREGQFLLSNESTLKIRYIADIAIGLMPRAMAKAIAFRLAADAALRLTGDGKKETAMERKYDKQLAEARAADGQENSPEEFEVDVWIASRL
jgi:hypothetical protein